MTLQIELPDEVAKRLQQQAEATGAEPHRLAAHLIEKNLQRLERLDQTLSDTRASFDASGLTEEELGDLLEQEKHAQRRGD